MPDIIGGSGCEAAFARAELAKYLNWAGTAFHGPAVIRLENPDALGSEDMTDGFTIHRNGDTVVIRAENGRGLLYGAYEYIENAIGVRWADPPFGEVDTSIRNDRWPEAPVSRRAAFPYRGGCMHRADNDENFVYNIDRLGKFRLNRVLLFTHQLPLLRRNAAAIAQRGVHVTLGGHCWPYFLYDRGRLSPSDALAAHPEWHALIDGQRLPCADAEAQFCLSCEEALARFTANVLDTLAEYNDLIDTLSLWPNDTAALFCECPQCASRSHVDLVLRLINRVAAAVRARWPHISVEMLAYEDFTEPPREERPSEGVLVNFAAIGRDYRLPYVNTTRRGMALRRDMLAWRALCGNNKMIVYEYYRLDGVPKRTVISDDLRLLRDDGLSGVMEDTFQDNDPDGVPDSLGFMLWLESRMLWNPDESADVLQRGLLCALFPTAYDAVSRALLLLEQAQASYMHYDLTWHQWQQRRTEEVAFQKERMGFIVETMKETVCLLTSARTDAVPAEVTRLNRFIDALHRRLSIMRCLAHQINAQLTLMTSGDVQAAQSELDEALLTRCASPDTRPLDELSTYMTAYGLSEALTRRLIPIDRKDRVGRIAIMNHWERICLKTRAARSCINCTLPVCPEAVRMSALRGQP